jgi:F-type H+-transporting ATPase subunit b
MPQISQISEIFASQLFWLIVTFGLIYAVIGRGMLPKIEATVEQRDRRIADDLAVAEAARRRADEIEEAYRVRAEASRSEAMKLVQAAKQESAKEAEIRVKASDADLNARVAEAEGQIRAAAQAALREIDSVAAEAAQDLVARLSGAKVTKAQAVKAVKQAIANG